MVMSLSRLSTTRKIAPNPIKILDAPSLEDDFYLNLVDWGNANVLAVGLGESVYLWNSGTGLVAKLCSVAITEKVTSVSWMNGGQQLAVGSSDGYVRLWDAVHSSTGPITEFAGHTGRVSCLSWNGSTLSSGGRDHSIIHRDTRSGGNIITKLSAHNQEVCGLKWSPDGRELASGGNDNNLFVWQPQVQIGSKPYLHFDQHEAAVKAIAWSPHQHGLLASGGGTADRCIRFWSTLSKSPLNYIDTGSQVCNIVWSKNTNEIVSTHGYSQNQINIWQYPSMNVVATLTGHTYRVLYLSMSPDGQYIVTGAGDESLRLWNVFPPAKTRVTNRTSPLATFEIR
jgi:cell division cycle 20-like protein 1 (cofactor of APC complex)